MAASTYEYVFHHNQVVKNNSFSEGGATQLDYDVSKVMVSLLAEFFVDIPSVHLLEMYVYLNHNWINGTLSHGTF